MIKTNTRDASARFNLIHFTEHTIHSSAARYKPTQYVHFIISDSRYGVGRAAVAGKGFRAGYTGLSGPEDRRDRGNRCCRVCTTAGAEVVTTRGEMRRRAVAVPRRYTDTVQTDETVAGSGGGERVNWGELTRPPG